MGKGAKARGPAPLRAPLAPTGGAKGKKVEESAAAVVGISVSHLSVMMLGGEAGDFKPPRPRFLLLPFDCTHSPDVGTVAEPPGDNRYKRADQRDGWIDFDKPSCYKQNKPYPRV